MTEMSIFKLSFKLSPCEKKKKGIDEDFFRN